MIPDPTAPHRRAIDPKTGRLAHGVFIGPARGPGDPPPTAAEVEAMVRPENHIGYTSTHFDDYDSAVDAYVDHGPPPEARPIGFLPPSDPTRRSED